MHLIVSFWKLIQTSEDLQTFWPLKKDTSIMNLIEAVIATIIVLWRGSTPGLHVYKYIFWYTSLILQITLQKITTLFNVVFMAQIILQIKSICMYLEI